MRLILQHERVRSDRRPNSIVRVSSTLSVLYVCVSIPVLIVGCSARLKVDVETDWASDLSSSIVLIVGIDLSSTTTTTTSEYWSFRALARSISGRWRLIVSGQDVV